VSIALGAVQGEDEATAKLRIGIPSQPRTDFLSVIDQMVGFFVGFYHLEISHCQTEKRKPKCVVGAQRAAPLQKNGIQIAGKR
jgi:hypothetical protein